MAMRQFSAPNTLCCHSPLFMIGLVIEVRDDLMGSEGGTILAFDTSHLNEIVK